MNVSRFYLLLVVSTAVSGIAQAQSADWSFGGQLSLSHPLGDLGDKDWLKAEAGEAPYGFGVGKLGYGIGGHAMYDLKGGHAIVGRVDYTMFKRDETYTGDGWNIKVKKLDIGADYNYYLSGRRNEGLYGLAGLGFSSGKYEWAYTDMGINKTKSAIYLALGGGYFFTKNFGAELRYVHVKYNGIDLSQDLPGGLTDVSFSAPTLNLSFVARY